MLPIYTHFLTSSNRSGLKIFTRGTIIMMTGLPGRMSREEPAFTFLEAMKPIRYTYGYYPNALGGDAETIT